MTNRRRGSQLRHDILRYLLNRERSSDSSIPGLDEIAGALGLPKEDINDQLDILESQGAIKSNRTFTDAAPILTGAGKAILEEMEERSETSFSKEITEVEKDNSPHAQQELQWDAFICHASEDKDTFVRHLANELISQGIRIWYDEFTLRIGDSLRRSIDKGLAASRYGIVVLSHAFFTKEWPQKELDGLVVRERNGQKVILPVWLGVSFEDVAGYSPPLADRVAAKASEGLDKVVAQLLSILRPNSLKQEDISKPDNKNQKARGYLPNVPQPAKSATHNQRAALYRVVASTQLNMLRTELTSEVSRYGFGPEMGYKDVCIAPQDPPDLRIDKGRLIPLIQNCRVRLRNWGGLDFPFEKRPETREIRLRNAVRYIDTTPLPHSTKSFHFWQIDEKLLFFHRNSLDEDYDTNESGETPFKESLAYSWILMDIVRPLLFTQNLLTQVNTLKALTIKYVWGGLLGRSLIMLMHRRRGFPRDYCCQGVNEWNHRLIVNGETDMLGEAQNAAFELFWLFGWEPSEQARETIDRDLQTFVSGAFPD